MDKKLNRFTASLEGELYQLILIYHNVQKSLYTIDDIFLNTYYSKFYWTKNQISRACRFLGHLHDSQSIRVHIYCKHKTTNIMRLIGVCWEKNEETFGFQYMSNRYDIFDVYNE